MRKKVLVCDDRADVVEILKVTLEMLKIQVITTTSVDEAFVSLNTWGEHIGVVITDMDMPHVPGSVLAKWVLNDPRFSHIHVAVLSGLTDARKIAEEIGVKHIFLKSETNTIDNLITMVKTLLCS